MNLRIIRGVYFPKGVNRKYRNVFVEKFLESSVGFLEKWFVQAWENFGGIVEMLYCGNFASIPGFIDAGFPHAFERKSFN